MARSFIEIRADILTQSALNYFAFFSLNLRSTPRLHQQDMLEHRIRAPAVDEYIQAKVPYSVSLGIVTLFGNTNDAKTTRNFSYTTGLDYVTLAKKSIFFNESLCPEIKFSSIDCAQLNRFHLKTDTESSLRNVVHFKYEQDSIIVTLLKYACNRN
jgi:hypothetical protein